MFTKRIFLAVRIYYFVNSIFRIIPYEWNNKTKTCFLSKDKVRWLFWSSAAAGIVSIDIYFIIRLAFHFMSERFQLAVHQVVLIMFYIVSSILLNVINFTILCKAQEVVTLMNANITTVLRIWDEFSKITVIDQSKRDRIGTALCLFIPVAVPLSFLGGHIAVMTKYGPARIGIEEIVFNILPFLGVKPFRKYFFQFSTLVVFGGLFYTMFVTFFYCLLGIIYIESTDSLMKHIAIKCPQYYIVSPPFTTAAKRLQRKLAMLVLVRKSYSISRILNTSINNHVILIAPTLMLAALALNVISNYGSIKLYSVFPTPYNIVLPVFTLSVYLVELGFIPQGAKMHTCSIEMVNKWKSVESKYMHKWLMCCRPLRMEIGPFFNLSRLTILLFFTAVVDLTTNLLISL